MKKPFVITAHGGCGKTFLAEKYPNFFTDLVSGDFKYDNIGFEHFNQEERKGMQKKLNSNWPKNYIDEIVRRANGNKILLIAFYDYVMSELLSLGIDVILVYPLPEIMTEYKKRYAERGNTQEWINKTDGFLANIMNFAKNNPKCKAIVMSKGEFLEDALVREKIFVRKFKTTVAKSKHKMILSELEIDFLKVMLEVAKRKEVITYSELNRATGSRLKMLHFQMGRPLANISKFLEEMGETPTLAAIVVSARNKLPSSGFFNLPKIQLELFMSDKQAHKDFLLNEIDKVHKHKDFSKLEEFLKNK